MKNCVIEKINVCFFHTSSNIKIQSLSSSSLVRWSLNNVTAIVWLSGTAHLMLPLKQKIHINTIFFIIFHNRYCNNYFKGSIMVGSHSKASEMTLLERRDQTMLNLFGFLKPIKFNTPF